MKKSTVLALAVSLLSLPIAWATNKLTSGLNKEKNTSPQTQPIVMELTAENAQAVLTNIPTIIIVDFYADWCGPCRNLKPIFEEVAQELKDKYAFAKINIDICQEVAKQYQVSSLPTIAIISNGKIIDKIVGLTSKKTLLEKIEQAVKGPQDLSALDQKALNEKLLQSLQSFASPAEIKRFLDAGADVNCTADNGLTPLMFILMMSAGSGMDSSEMVKVLLEYGAMTQVTSPQTGQPVEAVELCNSMLQHFKRVIENYEKLVDLLKNNQSKKAA